MFTTFSIQGETEMKTLLYTVCNSVLDFFYEIVEVVDDEEEDDGHLEWLYDLQELQGEVVHFQVKRLT